MSTSQEKVCLENRVLVRAATEKDVYILAAMIENYDQDDIKAWGSEIDKDILAYRVGELIANQAILIAEYNKEPIGAIAGYIMDCLFNKDIIFSAMFFFIYPKHRNLTRQFLREIEITLLPSRVTKMAIAIPDFKDAEKLGRFMKISGFKKLETHYYKQV